MQKGFWRRWNKRVASAAGTTQNRTHDSVQQMLGVEESFSAKILVLTTDRTLQLRTVTGGRSHLTWPALTWTIRSPTGMRELHARGPCQLPDVPLCRRQDFGDRQHQIHFHVADHIL